jgi:Ca-activated chloride channel family protein
MGLVLCALLPATAPAQTSVHVHHHHYHGRPLAANLIIPQSRAFSSVSPRTAPVVRIERVTAHVSVVDQVATTVLEVSLRNPSNRRLEAEVILPVPEGATVRGFDFQGSGSEPSAKLLPKDEARRIYDSIVAKIRDPALLEFIGFNLIRSSVFPVEARGTQKIRLTYEQICPADGNRIDYVLPRSESLQGQVPWEIQVTIKSKRPLATVYSPSHAVDVKMAKTGRRGMVKLRKTAEREPGSFRLSLLRTENETVTATLMAYPDAKIGGGYFLLLGGVPDKTRETKIKREVTLLLDRSGSMAGEKLRQVRRAALEIIAGLDPGESFNIIVYNEAVEVFSTRPVVKNEANVVAAEKYLESVQARGGTNIHDALVEALRQKPTKDTLPMVLFLTDGLPTIGQTDEKTIREAVEAANDHKKRVFAFGVGFDVNSPLLESVALVTRATATFVLPKEDIETKVAAVFRRLAGPIFANPELTAVDPDGKPGPRVRDVVPGRLNDIFDGDQFVVVGQYLGEKPIAFELTGDCLGKPREFRFQFKLDKATTRNSFVPRLWAQRKIAVLVDAIRATGADPRIVAAGRNDSKTKELVDEVVRLSTEFGILTEYTAFLAREGSDLTRRRAMGDLAWRNFNRRAQMTRSGMGSINQEMNNSAQRSASVLNRYNAYLDENMNRVQIATVQQVADRAFYRKGARWVDSRVVDRAEQAQPQAVVEFGSEEFMKLARRLASENRQGAIMMQGEIMLVVDGQRVLVRNPN